MAFTHLSAFLPARSGPRAANREHDGKADEQGRGQQSDEIVTEMDGGVAQGHAETASKLGRRMARRTAHKANGNNARARVSPIAART